MRTLVLILTAAALLGTGAAFSLQATRPSVKPIEIARTPTEPSEAQPAVPPAATPMTFRQVRSVAITEPESPPKAPAAAAPAESPHPDSYAVNSTPRADANQHDGLLAEAKVKPAEEMSRSVTVAAVSTNQAMDEPAPVAVKEVASRDRHSAKARHASKHLAALSKHLRGKRRVRAASTEDAAPMPAAALAYEGANENHSPFHSLGKVFSGAQ